MLFIIYFMIQEIQSLFRLKFSYFCHIWSLINIIIIICSWAGTGTYIWRYYEGKRIGHHFQETHGYAYINLQLTSYINDIFNFLLCFCCFFGTIRLLYFCRLNRRLSIFNDTIQYAGKDLLSFMCMFIIIFLAFLILFYQLFVSKILSCSSLLNTAAMLFQMILLKFDTNDLYNANIILGPICFTLFILVIVFICMSMFISIIVDSFRIVQKKSEINGDEDHQVFIYMVQRFLRWIGFVKQNTFEIHEEQDRQMRSQYYDPIEYFPEITDRLMNALYQVTISFSFLL